MNATGRQPGCARSDFADAASVGETTPAKHAVKPFSLRAPKIREIDLQGQIVDYLLAEQARGRIVWFARCNSGSVMSLYKGRRSFTRFYALYLRNTKPAYKGMADVHGMLLNGRYFALEIKRPGEKATAEQRAFLDAVRAGGGIAAVVTGFEEVALALGEIKCRYI